MSYNQAKANVFFIFTNALRERTIGFPKNGFEFSLIHSEILSLDVAFTAQFGARISVSGGQKIVFTNVITNVGDAYNNVTGIFTAPRNGTYMFTLTTMTTNNNHWAYLSVNGVITSRVHAREFWLIGNLTTDCGKVMFSQASVILSTGGVCGRDFPGKAPPGQTHTPCPVHAGIHTPPAQCML